MVLEDTAMTKLINAQYIIRRLVVLAVAALLALTSATVSRVTKDHSRATSQNYAQQIEK